MKVTVIGGTGVFGSRLAEMLVRDGHSVTVISRTLSAAQVHASKIGADALALDRTGDLATLWALKPDVVVDAAGPFQAYGDDPYRLPRACIEQGVSYLDLADDTAFCAGITELDEVAKAKGVFVLSGVSSVPALSAAAVRYLSADMDKIDEIATAILPGNRAPRGQAVVDSILSQAGTEIAIMLDGRVDQVRNWSQSRLVDLGQGIKRRGYMINVPDLALFPTAFNARTVTFHAGLELWVMNTGLSVFSWMRSKLGFDVPVWLMRATRQAAEFLFRFGTDVGGMSVRVTGTQAGKAIRSEWHLIAKKGDGPYIPAIAARTLLRAPKTIQVGARPAIQEVVLGDAVAAMSDLACETNTITETPSPLVPIVLGRAFDALPTEIKETHNVVSPQRFNGQAEVRRGKSLLSRLIGWVFRFPKAGETVPVTVIKSPMELGEIWERRFGASKFRSFMGRSDQGLTESFWPFSFQIDLAGDAETLSYPIKSGRLGWIPLPRWALPKSDAQEFVKDGKFWFDVKLSAPLTGYLLVHYTGWLEREAD